MFYKLSAISLLFISNLSMAQEFQPWSIGLGFMSTSSELEGQKNKSKNSSVYWYASYRPLEDLRLSITLEPKNERFLSEKKCDSVGCYEVNLKTRNLLLEANWVFVRFDSRYISWLALGAGYVNTDAELEVEETFVTYPNASAKVTDTSQGLSVNLAAAVDITPRHTLALKFSQYWRESFFQHTSRSLSFNSRYIKLEYLYSF